MSEQSKEAGTDDWAAALAEQQAAELQIKRPRQAYQAAGFQALQQEPVAAPGSVNLDMLMEVPVTLSMEIGRARIPIRNLLQLNQGSVVELDRLAGEPLDVLVNGTLIAHGEVVVINEKFGIRLTDVISPAERVRKLR